MSEANIWEPRVLAEVSADTKRVTERLTATAGQVLFDLKSFAYSLNTGALQVFRQGSDTDAVGTRALIPNIEYVEQTATSFSLVTAAVEGEQILVVGYIGIEGTVDPRDTDIYVTNYQAIRDYAGVEITLYAQGTTTPGDAGEAFFQYLSGEAPGTYVDDNESVIVPDGGDGSAGWVRSPSMPISRFPNVNADITASDEELNVLDGLLTATNELNYLAAAIAAIGTFLGADDIDAARQAIGYPALTGNALKLTRINSGESALEAVDPEAVGISGEIRMWPAVAAPTGWLLCDGSNRSDGATTGAALYAIIGTTFGGTGVEDFDLPDFRGRSPVGVGTGDASDATAHTLAEKEGTETHTLTEAELAAHTHPGTVRASNGSTGDVQYTRFEVQPADGTTGSTGGDDPHNNLQPSLGINFIIKS